MLFRSSNQVVLNVNPAPQQITVMAQNANLYCSSDIEQPIWVENMNNIGSFSFTLIPQYDFTLLSHRICRCFYRRLIIETLLGVLLLDWVIRKKTPQKIRYPSHVLFIYLTLNFI